jgi:hypothetical protein
VKGDLILQSGIRRELLEALTFVAVSYDVEPSTGVLSNHGGKPSDEQFETLLADHATDVHDAWFSAPIPSGLVKADVLTAWRHEYRSAEREFFADLGPRRRRNDTHGATAVDESTRLILKETPHESEPARKIQSKLLLMNVVDQQNGRSVSSEDQGAEKGNPVLRVNNCVHVAPV